MARISKRVREEAIEALLVCADDRHMGGDLTTYDILGRGSRTHHVADRAWSATGGRDLDRPWSGRDPQTRYLEAAALLRDGWSPGDPVHLIAKEGK